MGTTSEKDKRHNRKYYALHRDEILAQKRGHYQQHREEKLDYQRRYYEIHRDPRPWDSRRRWHYKRKYGLTETDIDAITFRQGNCCAICHQPFTQLPTVDHCHSTGAIRGLLCRNCNSLLGQAHDDVDVLRNAVAYIVSFSQVGGYAAQATLDSTSGSTKSGP